MASPTPFAGKVIAVTGAASGIGLATAHYLALRGASLSLADLNVKPLSDAKASIQKECPKAQILTTTLNVTKAADVNAWIATTISTFHKLDGAANLAGVFSPSGNAITEMDDGEWDAVISVNLTGVMYCLRAELKVLEKGGSIVNASSVAGLVGSSGYAAYTASKHGVVGLTRSAAREEGGRGVRVNCICP
jgi:NAD(P)-dependent dehydrogenase (short-subunit alcohol dehydrogenase family)